MENMTHVDVLVQALLLLLLLLLLLHACIAVVHTPCITLAIMLLLLHKCPYSGLKLWFAAPTAAVTDLTSGAGIVRYMQSKATSFVLIG